MISNTFSAWEQMHQNLHSETASFLLSAEAKDSWARCRARNLDYTATAFPRCTGEALSSRLESLKKIYTVINRLLPLINKHTEKDEMGFAFFDRECCLLKLYGSERFYSWAAEKGISAGTLWSEEALGTNSVSLGNELQTEMNLPSVQNYGAALMHTAVYYSPMMDFSKDGQRESAGGIALIGPEKDGDNAYSVTVVAIAKMASMLLHVSNLYTSHNSVRDWITLEINSQRQIIYLSPIAYEALNVSSGNYTFRELDSIFDPLPKNKEFWEIVYSLAYVSELPVRLSIQGCCTDCLLTTKPTIDSSLDLKDLTILLQKSSASENQKSTSGSFLTFDDIIGEDPAFQGVIQRARAFAALEANLLILGESGVGKDIFAQAIHSASKRKDKPFIAINCASFPKDLIASELFGYEAGAFTGSKKGGQPGKFELADQGPIFLDEIGEMPIDLQAMLLRILEHKSFMRLGSNKEIKLNFRIIAATNADLKTHMLQKSFREDLYYRLSVLKLPLLPLREHTSDIPLIVKSFNHTVLRNLSLPPISFSEEAMALLQAQPWRGNVRELQNFIILLASLYPGAEIQGFQAEEMLRLEDDCLRPLQQSNRSVFEPAAAPCAASVSACGYRTDGPPAEAKDREILINALQQNGYNKRKTAEYLGIDRSTLYRRMKHYQIPT